MDEPSYGALLERLRRDLNIDASVTVQPHSIDVEKLRPVPVGYVSFAANQSIANNVNQALAWDVSSSYVTGGMITKSSGLVVPSNGIYLATLHARWVESAVGLRELILTQNGTILNYDLKLPPAAPSYLSQEITRIVVCKAGDLIGGDGFQNSGAALSIYGAATDPPYIQAVFISNI